MPSRVTPKERGLLKGALNRVFSRSELRREALQKSIVADHVDLKRPRVTKWSKCPSCKLMTPTYLMDVDHINPKVRIEESFDSLSLDVYVEERLWCELSNLEAICRPCHTEKSKIEGKLRRAYKKSIQQPKPLKKAA